MLSLTLFPFTFCKNSVQKKKILFYKKLATKNDDELNENIKLARIFDLNIIFSILKFTFCTYVYIFYFVLLLFFDKK